MSQKTAGYTSTDKLQTLEAALDPNHMIGVFQSFLSEHLGRTCSVLSVGAEIIRNRSSRCVIRYRVGYKDARSPGAKQMRFFGKVFRPGKGEHVMAQMQTIWDHGFASGAKDGIAMPCAVKFLPELCLLIQEEIPGLPAKDLLKLHPEDPECMRLVARTIAKLHQADFVPGDPFTVRDHLLRCHPRHPFLALACPELESEIDSLVRGASRVADAFSDVPLRPVHGDFHLRQIHIEADRAWLIDFDALCYADPAADIGNLLVFLKAKAARKPSAQKVIDVFLEAYIEAADEATVQRAALYEGMTHLRRACKVLRYQKPGWRRRVAGMIEAGLQRIETASNFAETRRANGAGPVPVVAQTERRGL